MLLLKLIMLPLLFLLLWSLILCPVSCSRVALTYPTLDNESVRLLEHPAGGCHSAHVDASIVRPESGQPEHGPEQASLWG